MKKIIKYQAHTRTYLIETHTVMLEHILEIDVSYLLNSKWLSPSFSFFSQFFTNLVYMMRCDSPDDILYHHCTYLCHILQLGEYKYRAQLNRSVYLCQRLIHISQFFLFSETLCE